MQNQDEELQIEAANSLVKTVHAKVKELAISRKECVVALTGKCVSIDSNARSDEANIQPYSRNAKDLELASARCLGPRLQCNSVKDVRFAPLAECFSCSKELITILPYNIVEEDTHKIILYLSDSSQPAVSRYIAGRMIGFVADVSENSGWTSID